MQLRMRSSHALRGQFIDSFIVQNDEVEINHTRNSLTKTQLLSIKLNCGEYYCSSKCVSDSANGKYNAPWDSTLTQPTNYV